MKQNFATIYKIMLLIGDSIALLLAFTLAYILRISLDPRPVSSPVKALTYITIIATLLPIWLGVFALLGLYSKRNFERRPKEASRLLVGSIFGVIGIITFDFFSPEVILPAKLIPIYATLISFVILSLVRTSLRWVRLSMYRHAYGIVKTIIVGNSDTTFYLTKYLADNVESGYKIVGVVANKKHIYKDVLDLQFSSLKKAIEVVDPHAIIQTDSEDVTKIYNLAVENHLNYQFIPTHEALFTVKHSVELLGAFPIINVHTTKLIGWGRLFKRALDILLSLLGIILFSPLIVLVAALIKITDYKGPIIFRQKRLTRFGDEFNILKFRTLKANMSGRNPEEVFRELNRPDLLEEFQKNRSKLENDPRITTLGVFLRRYSLDELPQLLNILKGDISLVGPRSIPKNELVGYEQVSPTVLSVKSGLTGLAQIYGRSDISMQERLDLDVFYVQNWSLWMDLQIIVRTIFMVLSGKSAK